MPFLAIVIQLGLALLVVHQFQLESRTFFKVGAVIAGGFVVHALLPLRFRQAFFAALSVATVFVVFDASTAMRLVGLAAVLIGLCHAPLRFGVRVAAIVGVGLLLVLFRAEYLSVADGLLPGAAWAILGSMFMFRLALYLHALKTREPGDPPPTLARTVAYFFMAPNVTFPLFPVIDYNRFAKNYYDRPAIEIYQTGAKWIARGLLHLVLYRFVYSHLANDPTKLANLGDVVRYLLSTYLLYLRVSGSFHVIVGMLCLFGYNLPETHHLYYLADSFNDYWRRINIYWKDFMMKLVYYPSFFRLRKLTGSAGTKALVGATICVFASTWLLHSYQWFWLRGDFPVHTTDLLFWGILGALVVWNAVRESQRGRARSLAKAQARWSARRAVRVLATFTTICVLWSLWSSDTTMPWIVMWRAAIVADAGHVAVLVGLLLAGLGIAGWRWDAPTAATTTRTPWYRHTAIAAIAVLAGLLALTRPWVRGLFPEKTERVLESLQRSRLNARDAGRLHRGYYEKMDLNARRSTELWNALETRPEGFLSFMQTEGSRPRNDFLLVDNRPSTSVENLGVTVNINRWGMRGAEVDEAKAPGTIRVAFGGPSYVFGTSVPDSATLESWFEKRLNRERPVGGAHRFESLNFAVGGTSIIQTLAMLDDRAFRFAPDIVIIGVDSLIPFTIINHLTDVVERRIDIPYGGLRSILTNAGVEVSQPEDGYRVPFHTGRQVARKIGLQVRMPKPEVEQRIMMSVDTLATWGLRELVARIRAHGAIPVAAVINLVHDRPLRTSAQYRRVLSAAAEAGFIVADLRDTWERAGFAQGLRVSSWDDHPSALGYRLLADRLYEELEKQDVFSTLKR